MTTTKRMFRCVPAGLLCVSLLVALCLCSGRAASTDGKPKIHYGDIVRFLHLETGKYLYSFPGIYTHASTSHQQAVVAIPFKDSNTHWVVVPPSGQSLENLYFKEVQPGAFRLEHHNTRRLLHSHVGHPSPVSKGQEVTCFDAVNSADINNDWFPHVTPGHGAQIARYLVTILTIIGLLFARQSASILLCTDHRSCRRIVPVIRGAIRPAARRLVQVPVQSRRPGPPKLHFRISRGPRCEFLFCRH